MTEHTQDPEVPEGEDDIAGDEYNISNWRIPQEMQKFAEIVISRRPDMKQFMYWMKENGGLFSWFTLVEIMANFDAFLNQWREHSGKELDFWCKVTLEAVYKEQKDQREGKRSMEEDEDEDEEDEVEEDQVMVDKNKSLVSLHSLHFHYISLYTFNIL